MPIGKSSITKRVAKQTQPDNAPQKETSIAPELVATVGAPAQTAKKETAQKQPAKKAPAKKTETPAKKTTSTETKKPTASSSKSASKSTSASASKSASSTKKSAPKKDTVKVTLTPPEVAPEPTIKKSRAVTTGVLSGVAPETVEKVTGHKENTGFEKFSFGDELPVHLL